MEGAFNTKRSVLGIGWKGGCVSAGGWAEGLPEIREHY